jgi:hypothetical protein
MKKLVCSAIALSLTSATGFASGSDWSTLDQEVQALAASLSNSQDGGGMSLNGMIRSYYASSSDIQPFGGDDLGGFVVIDARIGVSGERGDYTYDVLLDLGDNDIGGAAILDAFATFPIGGTVKGRFGQFRPGISRSGLVYAQNMMFVDRGIVGAMFAGRQPGGGVFGEFDQFNWRVDFMNGDDSVADELLIAVRGTFAVLGTGKDLTEGAYGGTEDLSAVVGLSFYDDGSQDDSAGFVIDFHGGTSVYSFGLDIADLDDDLMGGLVDPDTTNFLLNAIQPDSTPFSLYGTYMFQPEKWEVGLRYEDADDSNDSTKIDIIVSNYIDGHNAKWGFQYSTIDSDAAALEVDIIYLQLQLVF